MKKIRIWDSQLLTNGFVLASQFKQNIETLFGEFNLMSIKEMPPSMIPSDTLYEIVLGYVTMYNTLLDHELLNTGNRKVPNISNLQ